MMLRLIGYIALVFFITSDACAQNSLAKADSNEPLSEAFKIMQEFDFNSDGKISKKEFVVFDGNTGYRAHLSNIHKGLNIEKNDSISLREYWFIEITDPAKYQADLKKYFTYMDKDSDGYISVEEYQNTFQGSYISKFGLEYAQMIDANHDNKISYDEYVNFDFTSIGYHGFYRLDFNNDSFVTRDELDELFSYFNTSW